MLCQDLVKSDFFLQIYAEKFMHEARVMICEMHCTINRRVDLVMLAQKLQVITRSRNDNQCCSICRLLHHPPFLSIHAYCMAILAHSFPIINLLLIPLLSFSPISPFERYLWLID